MLTARTDSLRKRFFLYVVPLFSITPLAVAGQNTTKPGSLSDSVETFGWITVSRPKASVEKGGYGRSQAPMRRSAS